MSKSRTYRGFQRPSKRNLSEKQLWRQRDRDAMRSEVKDIRNDSLEDVIKMMNRPNFSIENLGTSKVSKDERRVILMFHRTLQMFGRGFEGRGFVDVTDSFGGFGDAVYSSVYDDFDDFDDDFDLYDFGSFGSFGSSVPLPQELNYDDDDDDDLFEEPSGFEDFFDDLRHFEDSHSYLERVVREDTEVELKRHADEFTALRAADLSLASSQ